MSMTWLANADRDTSWAHHAWEDFAAFAGRDRALAILPVFGFADHGLGLPLDAEEIVGSAVLRRATELIKTAIPCRVLPPVRFGLAPYPSTFFGIDAETAHAILVELAVGVKAAGFTKLVFFSSSPWNKELVDATSRDIRVELGLQTFLVNTSGLGFDFHPASQTRAQAQAATSYLLDTPARGTSRPADISDIDFRPGCFRQPAPLAPDNTIDGAVLVAKAGMHFASLLSEIHAHAPLGSTDHRPAVTISSHQLRTPQIVFPERYRMRYLPALTRDDLENLPHKEHALVIIPTGAIEQHGHHLPVGVDAILGQAWLENLFPHLKPDTSVFVAPPLIYGKSNEHSAFPGTLSLSGATLRRLLLALATQLKALGFRQIAVLNTHGGNSAVLVYTLREIQTSLGLRAGLLGWPFKPEQTPQEAAYGFHAGEWETSLMLAVADELVDMTKAVCEYPAQLTAPGELRPESAPAIISWASQDISRSGVMGDATAATTDKGQRWLVTQSAALARRIEELLAR
jgi:creatinine amidohydrolase